MLPCGNYIWVVSRTDAGGNQGNHYKMGNIINQAEYYIRKGRPKKFDTVAFSAIDWKHDFLKNESNSYENK